MPPELRARAAIRWRAPRLAWVPPLRPEPLKQLEEPADAVARQWPQKGQSTEADLLPAHLAEAWAV